MIGMLLFYGLMGSFIGMVGTVVWSMVGYARANDQWEEEDVRQKSKKFFVWSFLLMIFCIVGIVIGAVTTSQANDRAEQAAREEEQHEQSARKADKEKSEARRMGVSLEQYRRGDESEVAAHSECRSEVAGMANWTASNNWGGGHSWRIDGDVITIHGNDIKMTNGFGGERAVNYSCKYNLVTKTVVVTSLN